jgi:hypothetical protein
MRRRKSFSPTIQKAIRSCWGDSQRMSRLTTVQVEKDIQDVDDHGASFIK